MLHCTRHTERAAGLGNATMLEATPSASSLIRPTQASLRLLSIVLLLLCSLCGLSSHPDVRGVHSGCCGLKKSALAGPSAAALA
jgi:hypothetical protein